MQVIIIILNYLGDIFVDRLLRFRCQRLNSFPFFLFVVNGLDSKLCTRIPMYPDRVCLYEWWMKSLSYLQHSASCPGTLQLVARNQRNWKLPTLGFVEFDQLIYGQNNKATVLNTQWWAFLFYYYFLFHNKAIGQILHQHKLLFLHIFALIFAPNKSIDQTVPST